MHEGTIHGRGRYVERRVAEAIKRAVESGVSQRILLSMRARPRKRIVIASVQEKGPRGRIRVATVFANGNVRRESLWA